MSKQFLSSDMDDAFALAVLHALRARGEARMLAITISTGDKAGASYVDLLNTFYGDPKVPVGIINGGEDLGKSDPKPLTYARRLSERKGPGGMFRYPHQIIDSSAVPEAVPLLRRTLAAQPDQSVAMIQVGFSTNYARLMESKADEISPLTGKELVRKKVRLLSVMAGIFADTPFFIWPLPKNSPEYNVKSDIKSAQKVFSSWPTPVVVSGAELGISMLITDADIERYFAYVPDHPLGETYREYISGIVAAENLGDVHHWHTADLPSVLYAVRPEAGYFSLSERGTLTVLDDGSTRFEESSNGLHRYLTLTPEQRARTLEAIVMLASQPPQNRVGN